jgi:hypothetical protein
VIYRDSVVLVLSLALALCSCASAPNRAGVGDDHEIERILAEAADSRNYQTCRGLVIDPEDTRVGAGAYAVYGFLVTGYVIGNMVLVPLAITTMILTGSGGNLNVPIPEPNSPAVSEAAQSRANSLARDRITARCVSALGTEQRVGPDHVEMAAPLVRLSEAYRLAAVDPKGLAMKQAELLYERASSLAERELARADSDVEYGKQIERALLAYVSALRESNRDWRHVCSRSERLRGAMECGYMGLKFWL